MDEAAALTGHPFPADSPVARRLRALAGAIPPLEIAELWVFPPIPELESSAEFFLLTRYQQGDRRLLYSARVRRENGSSPRQVVVEHGVVPADRVPGLVQRLRRRLGDGRAPLHVVIGGREGRWLALCENGANGREPGNGRPPAGAAGEGAVAGTVGRADRPSRAGHVDRSGSEG